MLEVIVRLEAPACAVEGGHKDNGIITTERKLSLDQSVLANSTQLAELKKTFMLVIDRQLEGILDDAVNEFVSLATKHEEKAKNTDAKGKKGQ